MNALRWLTPLLALAFVVGCSRPELAKSIVRAESEQDLAAFRAELGQSFTPEQLAPFDTALQELQLAGMDRGLTSAAARAAAMRTQVHGQTVRAVEILGWQARRTRLQSEIAQMTVTLEHDRQTRERQGAATSVTVANRITNVEAILAKLNGLLAETDQRLREWEHAAR